MSAAAPHLLVVTTNLHQNAGGVQEHLKALLPRLVERGLRTTAIYLGDPEPPQLVDGVQVLALQRHLDVREVLGVPHPGDWGRIERLVRDGDLLGGPPVTAIATHTRFFPMSYLGVRLGRRLNIPTLHTEHGGGSVITASAPYRATSLAVDLTMGRAVLRGADRVLAVSERSAAFVERLSGVSAHVLNNGVDLASWERPRGMRAPAGPRALVFVGRLVPEKGWRTFLDVVEAARRAGHNGTAHVFGAGPDEEAAQREVTTRGIADVVFHGHATAAQMAPALSGAVFVNPTLAAEGFQLTLVEAAAAGASVASYAVGGVDELGHAGCVDLTSVPQGDEAGLTQSVLALLASPPPEVVHDDLARWDWDHVADAYLEHVRALRTR